MLMEQTYNNNPNHIDANTNIYGIKNINILNDYLRFRFGCKVYKLSLNGGMTCPNRDGTLETRGCIFCSRGGSGDFASSDSLSIREQIAEAKKRVSSKISNGKYIAYFQAYTNTYASVDYLRNIFTEAILEEDIVALSIGTRPDCLGDDILKLLVELNQIKPVFIELGLQSIHEQTALFIRRGYDLPVFKNAVNKLSLRNIETIVHVIIGLPGETIGDILETIDYLNTLPIKGVKLQLLHILKDTDLADYYSLHPFHILTLEEYTDILIQCISHLRQDIVIHRMTGDGPKSLLIEPEWSANKRHVLNYINMRLKSENVIQGGFYICQ